MILGSILALITIELLILFTVCVLNYGGTLDFEEALEIFLKASMFFIILVTCSIIYWCLF